MADVDIKIILKDKGAKRQIQALINQMNRLQSAAVGVTKAFQRANKTTKDSAVKTAILGEKMKQAALRTQKLEQSLNKTANAGKRVSRGLGVANIALASFIGNLTSRFVSAGVTTLINGFRGLIDSGRNFEASLVEIEKTTGLSARAVRSFGEEILRIGQRIPVSTEALLDIAKVAGQLGISGASELTAFTETMAKLQLATDIAGEQGSQSVAKILTITGELAEDGAENIDKFGAVITQLGNNFAATESQILKVANEVAKGTTVFKLGSEDVLGLATAFKVTGSEAQISGSAIQRVFIEMGRAITGGGEKLRLFAESSQLTEDAFITLFESDPTLAFVKLAQGLGTTTTSGTELISKLEKLGFADRRLLKSVAPLIVQHEVLADAISQAREEAEKRTALDIETARAQNTLNADLVKLSNSFDKLATTIFKTIGPAFRSIIQSATEFTQTIATLVDDGTLGAVAAGLTAAAIATFLLTSSFVASTVSAIAFSITLHGVVTTALVNVTLLATTMWAALLAPITLIIAGIAALAIGVGFLVKKLGEADRIAKQHQETIESLAEGYDEADKQGKDFLDTLNNLTDGFTRATGVEERYRREVEKTSGVLLSSEDLQKKRLEGIDKATKSILLFEKEKTEGLKKFFKEEEIARLESNFAILKSKQEIEAFIAFTASVGKQRQREALNRILGLDKATIQSEREKQAELKRLREGEDQFLADREATRLVKLEELKAAQAQASLAEEQAQIFLREGKIVFEDEEFARLTANLDRNTQARIAAKLKTLDNERDKQLLLAQIRKIAAEEEVKQAKKKEDILKKLEKQRISNRKSTLSTISTLASSNNKELAIIGKTAGITQIAIDTPVAVSKALQAFPPPINFIAAAAVGAAMAAQAAQIAGVSFAGGGIVGGSSFSGDRVQANVNSGEMILNRQQQKELFNIANGTADSKQMINITVQSVLDGEVIAESVSQHVANGLILGEVQ